MQVSLTDYAVFERNGTWCHIVKKINAKTYAIEYEIQSGFISKEKAFESYQISLENYKTVISRIKKSLKATIPLQNILNTGIKIILQNIPTAAVSCSTSGSFTKLSCQK